MVRVFAHGVMGRWIYPSWYQSGARCSSMVRVFAHVLFHLQFIENGAEVPGTIPPIVRPNFTVKRSGDITILRTKDNALFVKVDFRKGNMGQVVSIRATNMFKQGYCGICQMLKPNSDQDAILATGTSGDSEFR